MDYFYKPPLQREDEWQALEDNYISCLVQKSMSDFKNLNAPINRCKMDSVSNIFERGDLSDLGGRALVLSGEEFWGNIRVENGWRFQKCIIRIGLMLILRGIR